MTSQKLTKLNLPDSPGVYTFRDAKNRPLYIGRATSLKDRVRSYFGADLIDTRGPRIVDMVTKSRTVTFEKTDTVLEAVLLESKLIKKYQPYYNIDERDDKSSQYVIITDEKWPRVFLARARDVELEAIKYKILRKFGPYPHSGVIKEALRILRRMFPFRDMKAGDPRHEAFYAAIGRSPVTRIGVGESSAESTAKRKYLRTIRYLILFFEGKKDELRRDLEKRLRLCARRLEFEECADIKKLLFALDHIDDIALIKEDRRTSAEEATGRANFRIEAYDIAHLGGSETVGAMVVSENGELAKSEYRKFKISRNANDDVAGLVETLSRRLNHTEWTYPDMIVVDGNRVQASHAEGVLKARRIAIPVVAVTKDERHKADKIIGNPELTSKYAKQIIAINAEAHRFAISFHRQRSRKGFLS